ncbi:MAG: hypothetical protein ACLGI6_17215, partial [Gammaproteobacteria bacterium]
MISLSGISPSPLGRLLPRFLLWFLALIITSVLLLAWQHYGMERVVVVTGPDFAVQADDDRGAGGASVATLEQTPDRIVMQCQVVAKFTWPYCVMAFTLSKEGMDLSSFSHVNLDLAYEGPGPREIRFRFLNREEGLFREGDGMSLKNNEVTGLTIPQG